VNPTARTHLIRSLYHAKAGGMVYKHSGKPLRPNTDPIEGPGFGVWGKHGLCDKPAVPLEGGLIFAPLPKEKIGPRPKRRRKGASALARIAEELPRKLPRLDWDTGLAKTCLSSFEKR
jgi:hypothetical protein